MNLFDPEILRGVVLERGPCRDTESEGLIPTTDQVTRKLEPE